jgi:hypothetical protein
MFDSNKPNCFECKWYRPLPYDAHIECVHPKIDVSDKFLTPLMMMSGLVSPAEKRLNVYGDSHGIKMGWFMWPLNFNPTWLLTCDGFERKEVKQTNEETKV